MVPVVVLTKKISCIHEYTIKVGGLTLLVEFHVASLLNTGNFNNAFQSQSKPACTLFVV